MLGAFDILPAQRTMRPFRFHFESMWTKHEGCEAVVAAGWVQYKSGVPMYQTMSRIAHTCMALNSWQQETFGNRRKEIELLRLRLQQLMSMSLSLNNLEEHAYISLSMKLEGCLEEERLYYLEAEIQNYLAQ